MAQLLGTVAHETHGRPAMCLHFDRNVRLAPHTDPEAADPGQDDQLEQAFQSVRSGDTAPLQVESMVTAR